MQHGDPRGLKPTTFMLQRSPQSHLDLFLGDTAKTGHTVDAGVNAEPRPTTAHGAESAAASAKANRPAATPRRLAHATRAPFQGIFAAKKHPRPAQPARQALSAAWPGRGWSEPCYGPS